MDIVINGTRISEAGITAEAAHHAEAPAPRESASYALAIRELLSQRAQALGLGTATGVTDDAVLDELLEREVRVPTPTEEECRRYYDRHREQFRSGDLVEASHILFAVAPGAPLNAIRDQAEATLRQLIDAPERFPELAAKLSNCPSGAQGGVLGQLSRGSAVPEFESALFEGAATGVLPQLVNTRHGFHIVCVHRRIDGGQVPFELAAGRIADYLSESVRRKAFHQYIRLLAAQADIDGIEFAAARSMLVQ